MKNVKNICKVMVNELKNNGYTTDNYFKAKLEGKEIIAQLTKEERGALQEILACDYTQYDKEREIAKQKAESKGMSREAIINSLHTLAMSQGFYGRLLRDLTDEQLDYLVEQNFPDVVAMVMFIEG